ncbi:MAG: hypothetical protein WBA41_00955 [Rivularia sp. (in: cyanobacteria)]
MLAQFQSLYPTGSLISELVQIYHGKYIVRSSVQIEGVTRATGMSAAETIEEAEDRSRTRALMVLAMQGESNVEAATKVEQIATSQPNLQVLSNRSLTTAVTAINEYANTTANPTEVTQTVSNTPAVSSQVTQTQTPVSNTPAVSSQVTQTEDESPTPEVFSEDDNDFYSQDFDKPLPIPTYDEPEFEAPIEDNQPDDEENQTEATASNVTPIDKSKAETTTKKTTKRKKKTEPVDLSDVIAKTDVELERLGWTPQQGREYLINTYGKRGRTLLTEEELLDFLNYLESIPTQMNLSQTDPLAGF